MRPLLLSALLTTLSGAACFPATASAATPSTKAHAPVPIGNIGQWFGADAYPPDAKRANEQGRVAVKVSVDAAGKPASCAVVGSSGSFALDSATCSIAMEHLTFTAATDDNGQPTAGVYAFATRWIIPRGEVAPAPGETPVPVSREQ